MFNKANPVIQAYSIVFRKFVLSLCNVGNERLGIADTMDNVYKIVKRLLMFGKKKHWTI